MLLTHLKPGMILSEDVQNFQGLLLLKAGTALSEKNIKILKTWGVTSVEIDGDGEKNRQNISDSPSDLKMAIEAEMKERFSNTLGHPVMEEVMKVATEIKIEKSMKNGQ